MKRPDHSGGSRVKTSGAMATAKKTMPPSSRAVAKRAMPERIMRRRRWPRRRALQAGPGCGTRGRDASVAVLLGLERAGLGHADIAGLLRAELGQLGADLLEVQGGDLLVQVLRQHVDLLLVLAGV